MKNKLKLYPIFIALIPLFFITHLAVEYWGSLNRSSLLLLYLIYAGSSVLLTYLLTLLIKTFWKSALMTVSLQILFFYFSSFHRFLKSIDVSGTFSRYSVLLPVVLILLLTYLIVTYRLKEKPKTFFLFLNSLFFLFILVDLFGMFEQMMKKNPQKITTINASKTEFESADQPSIYLLVFDEYASSASLKERFQFTNDLDTFLQQQGFRVISNSKSNYNFTPFSIASLLNMSYLNGFQKHSITAKDYQQTYELIRKNNLVHQLKQSGYTIINRSIFDLAQEPAYTHSTFLPSGLWILRKQTFFHYLNQDLGWHLLKYNTVFKNVYLNAIMESKKSNLFLSKEIVKIAEEPKNKPVFVYAHFNMPHPPYYFDSTGKERPEEQIVKESRFQINHPSNYLSYLRYTNASIQKMITRILKHEQDKAVIVLIGDHGYRSHIEKNEHLFMNFNAIYLPRRYNNIPTPDRISLVNEFRFIINTLTNKQSAFLPDSCIILKDQNPENAYKN